MFTACVHLTCISFLGSISWSWCAVVDPIVTRQQINQLCLCLFNFFSFRALQTVVPLGEFWDLKRANISLNQMGETEIEKIRHQTLKYTWDSSCLNWVKVSALKLLSLLFTRSTLFISPLKETTPKSPHFWYRFYSHCGVFVLRWFLSSIFFPVFYCLFCSFALN